MSQVYSHAGDTIAISTTAQNASLNQAGFVGLSYTAVGKVGSIGERGINTNILTYPTLGDAVVQKAKGLTNAGDPQVEVARDDLDAGQLAMRAAGAVTVKDAYAFKIVKQDGAEEYLRGLVIGPVSPGGGNEDFDLHRFTIACVQAPEEVEISA